MPETDYAECRGLSLAYQVFGAGPVHVVVAGSFVSHVELMWTSPEIKAFFDRLGSFSRVLLFDKAGVGLSDPVPKVRTIEERAEEIEAVMDAAAFEQAAILGLSEGGPAAIVFAASRPERVPALVLMGTYAASFIEDWSDLEMTPAELRRRVLAQEGETYAPSEQQIARFAEGALAVKDDWGRGEALARFLPSVRMKELGMLERMSASPGMARATLAANFRLDVRPVLSSISMPTLVIHAKDDFVPVQQGRYLADHIPGATLLEVEGSDHAPWLTQPERVLGAVERFLTGAERAPPTRRGLRTVLMTDIVGSTERAAEMGDEQWRVLLERFDTTTRLTVETFDGAVIKSTGDGHLVTLEGPAQAIRCAQALCDAARVLGIEIRTGIHTGECELMADDIGGLAVHIAARVMGEAGAGELLVSSTVRDLVVGSGIAFEDRGARELKGVPGTWRLLAVLREGAPAGSAEAALTSHPTPAPAGRPSDRMMLGIARRAPGVIRGMTRLANRGRSGRPSADTP